MEDAKQIAGMSRLERASKLIGVLNEFSKLAATAALPLVVLGVLAFPSAIKAQLEKLGLKLSEVDAGIVKLVATETVKAGDNTLEIADSLTKAEMGLSALGEALASPADGAKYADAIQATESAIRTAKLKLEEQSSSIQIAGNKAGVRFAPPKIGWLYVGYFGEDNKPRQLAYRIRPTNGVRYTGGTLSGIVLRFDAPVDSNGDDCSKTRLEDFMPDPAGLNRTTAIVKASDQPLRVLAVKECPSVGRGSTVFAQIEVPSDRVRFASLRSLPQ